MQITVRLFAALAEGAGVRSFPLDVPPGARAAAVRSALQARYPQMQALCERSVFAVNAEYAAADRLLYDGDEVALIPPVSGG
ncbi:MAG TPA: MoaD/ThiS family protein [Dehalococcoidia bacterium]|nr:MoaD/ThiS family protein [Dehalococcoidia bacterium]